MTPPPFFSILLPTRNRSEIVGDAIQSVLDQTCGDFELIVSDNDESETATRDAVARFNDPRIRYFRTSGQLPMHENWENAFNQASGEHVLILEDKQRLVRNALQILRSILEREGPIPISYNIKFARERTIPDPPSDTTPERWQSEAAIDLFRRFEQRFFNLLPKGLDSCAPRRVLCAIQKSSPTGMLFSYISPDYASGFLLLSAVPAFLHLRESLVYIPNNWMWQGKYSNGQASYRKTESYRRFLASLPVRREDILRHVPIQSEFLWINSVLYDFFTLYKPGTRQPDVDWVKYHGFCVILILMGRKMGAELTEEIADLKRSLTDRGPGFQLRVALDVVRRGFGLVIQMIRNRL